MRLGTRLSAAVAMVPPGAFLLDVGCDHAYLPIALYEEDRICGALASDVRPGPLQAAAEHIAEAGYADGIGTVLADGVPKEWRAEYESRVSDLSPEQFGTESDTLSENRMQKPLKKTHGKAEEANNPVCCSILGMGGRLISRIIREAADREFITDFVVSPQRDPDETRRALLDAGYGILNESFIEEEGKGYVIIHAGRGGGYRTLTAAEALYGPVLIRERNASYVARLRKREAELRTILNGLPETAEERRRELETELCLLGGIPGMAELSGQN